MGTTAQLKLLGFDHQTPGARTHTRLYVRGVTLVAGPGRTFRHGQDAAGFKIENVFKWVKIRVIKTFARQSLEL
jgi:hypothetical protein